MKKHLWEVKHPYYCNLGNYFAGESVGDEYKSWQDFIYEYKDADFDMNLVFRWDWESLQDDDEGNPIWNKDDNYRDGRLIIFWMGQRKGFYRYSIVEVCKNDEKEIIKFLEPRLKHLLKLWNPLIQENAKSS